MHHNNNSSYIDWTGGDLYLRNNGAGSSGMTISDANNATFYGAITSTGTISGNRVHVGNPPNYYFGVDVDAGVDICGLFENTNTSGFGVKVRAAPSNGARYIQRWATYEDDTRMTIQGNGELSAYSTITENRSDIRLKDNRVLIPSALDKVNSIGGYSFDWNDIQPMHEAGTHDIGLLAQEVQEVLPEAVCLAPFDTYDNEPGVPDYLAGLSKSGENYLTIQYNKVIPLLVNAIKELSAKVEAVESE